MVPGLGLALTGALIGLGLAAGGLVLSAALGRDITWELGPGPLVGFAVFVVLNSVMGMAFGTLLHNTTAAVVAFLGLPSLIALRGVALHNARDRIDPATTLTWVLDNSSTGRLAQILTPLGIWMALPLALGLLLTARRQIR